MDLQQIKALIDALTESDLSELEYKYEGSTLRLVKRGALPAATDTSPPGALAASPAQDVGAQAPSPPPTSSSFLAPSPELCAPVHGIVHLRPSPSEPPFAAVGQDVAAGQTLCVIEAMKIFNEVRAPRATTLLAVLVESGQEVESGQPMFRFGEPHGENDGAVKEQRV